MSEKRFSETERNCYYTSLVFDNQTQEELGTTKVVVLLNELSKENEQLRQTISNLKQEPTNKDWDLLVQKCAELSKRNIELHEQLGETQFNNRQCEKKVKELEQKLDWICEQTGYDGVKFHYINKH